MIALQHSAISIHVAARAAFALAGLLCQRRWRYPL